MEFSPRHGPTIADLRNIVQSNWGPPKNPYDEVYPNLFIGDGTTALSLRVLKLANISHVVNGASACASCLRKENCGGCVQTRSAYYTPDGIQFLGIQANDERRFPMYRYFGESTDFIHDALKSGGQSGLNNFSLTTAQTPSILKGLGITHILNAAVGTNPIRYVDTSQKYYDDNNVGCEFLGIPAMDIMNYQLHPFFITTTDFIDSGLSLPNGRVLVHCREGISRSATLVIAYLMMKKEMTAIEAVQLVRSKRQIHPNDGFLQQLCDLDLRLRGERSYRGR